MNGEGETDRTLPMPPEGLVYLVSRPVHDTLAVFVEEARRRDPERALYFVWRVYGVVERGITVEEGPPWRCDSVLVARSNRFIDVNGERFPLVVGDDYFAAYDYAMRPSHPGLGLGTEVRPDPLWGCWGGAEFPVVVRFRIDGEVTQAGRQGVVPARYVNPRYVKGREGPWMRAGRGPEPPAV